MYSPLSTQYDPSSAILSPELDLSQLNPAELEALERVRPDLKKQLDILRGLQAQLVEMQARTTTGFAVDDPEQFFTQVLGKRPSERAQVHGYTSPITPDQQRVVESVQRNKRTAVPAGHAVGKTLLIAWLVLWFLYGKQGSIVVTTAPTWNQVQKLLWSEIRGAWRGAKIPLQGRLLDTEIKISDDPKWYAVGFSTDDDSRFQGFHSRRVMIVFDEATGVREELWTAAESMIIRAEDRFVAIGNPTNPSSRFKAACDSDLWNVVTLDCRTHPNVVHDDPDIVPGAVTREWIEDRKLEYGGEDSPLFLARVAGVWPGAGPDSLIAAEWVDRARMWRDYYPTLREAMSSERGVALGLDVAGPGKDLAVLSAVEHGVLRVLWWTAKLDLMHLVSKIVQTVAQLGGRATALAIDDTGIGNGVSSRLIQLQRYARPEGTMRYPVDMVELNAAAAPLAQLKLIRVGFGQSAPDHGFWRMKDYLWWRTREALRQGQLGLPSEHEFKSYGFPRGHSLFTQLETPIYEILASSNSIKVWDKRDGDREKTRALPSRSPDIAHSVILANHAWRVTRPNLEVQKATTFLEQRKQYLADYFRNIRRSADQAQQDKLDQGPDFYRYVS